MAVMVQSSALERAFARLRAPALLALGLALSPGALAFTPSGRPVSIVETNRTGALISSVRLAFGPTTTETNTLFLAYGETDQGDDLDAWERVDPIGVVPPETDSLVCAMPRGWGDSAMQARFFLARGVVLPYDYEVEYLESDGGQYLNSGRQPCDSLAVRLMRTGGAGRRMFVLGIHAYVWYAINEAGNFTGGGACETNVVYDFVSTNGPVWINGVPRGTILSSSAGYLDDLFLGRSNLGIGAIPGGGFTDNFLAGRIYFVKKWKDGVPVYDAVPCVTNGVACFYDTVSRTFYRSATAGSYTPGPQVGLARDQDALTPVSCSETLSSDAALLVASDRPEPAGMDPAPGFHAVAAAADCTAPATCDVDGARYTCLGYALETYSDGAWAMVGTNASTAFSCPADGALRRLTWLWRLSHYKIDFAATPAAGGTVASDPAPADGYYPAGSNIVFTATPAPGRRVAGWEADWAPVTRPGWYQPQPFGVWPETPTLTVAADRPKTVFAGFSGAWTYANGQITDGLWLLDIGQLAGADRSIKKYRQGFGRLDLSTLEADTGLRAVKADAYVFYDHRRITSFNGPDVAVLADRAFQLGNALRSAAFSPDLESVGVCALYGCAALTNFQPSSAANLSEIGHMAFMNSAALAGDFHFPALASISASSAFSGCASVTGVAHPACTNLADQTFRDCTSLTNVVISGCAMLGSSSFRNIARGADIWYRGMTAPSAIKSDAFWTPNAQRPHVRIHVRNNQNAEAWRALCTRLRQPALPGEAALTAADLARLDYPGHRAVGIIAANGNFAWVLNWLEDSPTFILLR